MSVIRSGEAMESALRDCCLGIKIGKILVQRQGFNGEISGYSDSLPPLSVSELSAKMVRSPVPHS